VIALLRTIVGVVCVAWALFWGATFVATQDPLPFGLALACAGLAWWLLEDGS